MQPYLHGYYGKARDYYLAGMLGNPPDLVSFMEHMRFLSYRRYGHITRL